MPFSHQLYVFFPIVAVNQLLEKRNIYLAFILLNEHMSGDSRKYCGLLIRNVACLPFLCQQG